MHCLGERGVEGGKCSTSFFEVRKRAAVNQTYMGTVLNPAMEKILKDGMERIMHLPVRVDIILS